MSLSLKQISPEMKLSLKALKDKKYFSSHFVKKFLNLPVCTTFIKEKSAFPRLFIENSVFYLIRQGPV